MVTFIEKKGSESNINVLFALSTDTILNADNETVTAANGDKVTLGNGDLAVIKDATSGAISVRIFDVETKEW